jgi:CheY-like chemotaxis protein
VEKTRNQMEGQKKDFRLWLGLIPIALIVWLMLGTIDTQMRVSLIGGPDVQRYDPASITRAFKGATTLGIPFLTTTEVDLGNGVISPTESPSMIVASPILDAQGTVIAILTFFLAPSMIDGDQATTIIRTWEVDGQRARRPIVALTANAFGEEIEKSLLAGCDVHLTTPIKKQTLLIALVQAKTPTVAPGQHDA